MTMDAKESKEAALEQARMRKALTGKPQIVYESQPGHYLWCSEEAWKNGQDRISRKGVQLV